MTRWTDHNDTERMVMLQQAADAEGLPEYAVEKDWWVTMVLNRRFNGLNIGLWQTHQQKQ